MEIRQVAGLIQLAVAPIFLLTAVAGTLALFVGRLSRVIDRGRALHGTGSAQELDILEKRARLMYRAIALGVLSAIFVSLLMTLVFAGEAFNFDAARAVAFLFMAALFSYTGALLLLLREVFLAIGSFHLTITAPKA